MRKPIPATSQVQHDGHVGGGRHVVDAQQVEPGEPCAGDRAGEVAAVEEAEPRDPLRGRFHPAGNGRQRGAHENRRRQQDDARHDRPHDQARGTAARDGGVCGADHRHQEQRHQAEERNPDFEVRVDLQRMMTGIDVPGQQQASEAHAAHEHSQEDAKRDGRRSDGELEELEPDDFIDQGRTAGPHEEQEERRQPALCRIEADCGPRNVFELGHCPGNTTRPDKRLPQLRPRPARQRHRRATSPPWDNHGRCPGWTS
jgi:hypothetical protein